MVNCHFALLTASPTVLFKGLAPVAAAAMRQINNHFYQFWGEPRSKINRRFLWRPHAFCPHGAVSRFAATRPPCGVSDLRATAVIESEDQCSLKATRLASTAAWRVSVADARNAS